MKPLSLTAYAKHRAANGLSGTTGESVRRAVQYGRLDKSLVYVNGKAKVADKAKADEEWATNTAVSVDKTPKTEKKPKEIKFTAGEIEAYNQDASAIDIDFNTARKNREIETWLVTKIKRQADDLDLALKKGEVVEVAKVSKMITDEYTAVKTKLLGLSDRIRQRIPRLNDTEVAEIDKEVRESLSSLAGDAE